MKKIFVLGTSALQLPLINEARRNGMYVIGIDYNPDSIGASFCDKFFNISTIDIDLVYRTALVEKPDYITTCTSDMPVRTVAYVREKLNMPLDITYENSLCATDKSLMRKRFEKNGIPIPKYYITNNINEFHDAVKNFEFEFIVKPSDNSASRGVILANRYDVNIDDVYEYSKKYSHNGIVIVEEYINGSEVSVESFTVNGITSIISITDKLTSGVPQFVELGHYEPSSYSVEIQKSIIELTKKVIKSIGIINGPSHTEISIVKNKLYVIETASRLGGDYITSKLVPLSTGVDLIKASFDLLVGNDVDLLRKIDKHAAIKFLPTHKGKIKAIRGLENAKKIKGVHEIDIYHKIGDEVEDLQSSNDRVGHIIVQANSKSECDAILDVATNSIVVEYQ